ncbi:helicase-associated domain-containing protein [Lipingzhangella sp. LS1_29]|uniref:Helicase-associated domain-containing protein n=1 Tax=Lipingzhangella rawalii TaxID=2055835 RepID=A0ABU2H4H2_9ACTN|nr:helicase-associated domain-containing protein [Lipingzhangella rawalii]MDS1270198.1 helicase-associated domain-containing protein [Lipingzhangella rawalii]
MHEDLDDTELVTCLRERSSADPATLSALFSARPDLMTPVPSDLAALARRAVSRAALARALDELDRPSLEVLEGVLVYTEHPRTPAEPGANREELAQALSTPVAQLDPYLETLAGQALAWSVDGRLRTTPNLHALLTEPAGLGPRMRSLLAGCSPERLRMLVRDLDLTTMTPEEHVSELADELAEPNRVSAVLEELDPQARSVLDRLTWGPPRGTISSVRHPVPRTEAASPIESLLAHGVLVPSGETTVTLPREIALILRGGRLRRSPIEGPPELTGSSLPMEQVDRIAAGQAFTVVRGLEDLLDSWAETPPAALRDGGLGVRDLRQAARLLGTEETAAAVVLEAAHAAGLVNTAGGVGGEWLPTVAFDAWRAEDPAYRWLRLIQGWLAAPRAASRAGTPASTGSTRRPRSVLGPGLDHTAAPLARLEVLRLLAELPGGFAPQEEALAARLTWLRPRRSRSDEVELRAEARGEAALLGLSGRGALATHARILVAGLTDPPTPEGPGSQEQRRATAASAAPMPDAGTARNGHTDTAGTGEGDTSDTPATPDPDPTGGETEVDRRVVQALAAHLPQAVEHVLVQGDLTAVAPGPLVPHLARELELCAEVESTGGGTVYRFTESSLRRALDAGRGAEDVLALLHTHAATPIPQALEYLVRDVSRRHGRLRAGRASSYLRCDDPLLLDELLADPRVGGLALARLAPTVVASSVPRPTLLERLRELGYHPVAEATDGSTQIRPAQDRRAEGVATGSPPREPVPGTRPPTHLCTAAARAVHAGDAAARQHRTAVAEPTGRPPRAATEETLTTLSAAVASGVPLWIGYLDAEGQSSSRIIEPARLDGGYLTAYDATRAAVHRFAIHRITGAARVDEQDATPATADSDGMASAISTGTGDGDHE